MGAIIPYAVKLQVKKIDLLGTGVGNLYAFSSLGSIIGTLLTSFYLITMFGVRKIVFGEGILLVLMSVVVLGFYFRHNLNIKEK